MGGDGAAVFPPPMRGTTPAQRAAAAAALDGSSGGVDGSRGADGQPLPPGIRYHAAMEGVQEHGNSANTCCEGQGTRAIGSLPEYIYSIATAKRNPVNSNTSIYFEQILPKCARGHEPPPFSQNG